MIKMSVSQEDIILNTFTPKNQNSKKKKKKKQKLTELKGEIDSSTTIVGDLTYSTFNNE